MTGLIAVITWCKANWKLVAAGLVLAALAWGAWQIDAAATDRCEAGFEAREARHLKEQTNAANAADDAARRCAGDPACRLSDDGYRRD